MRIVFLVFFLSTLSFINPLFRSYSVVKLPASSPDEPVLEITVIVDPVSRGAQKVGPIISVLRQVLNTEIKIFLNCEERLSDMPLKRYSKLSIVIIHEVQF